MRQPRLRTVLVGTGAMIALVAGSTTAYAATAGPADGSGVIHGCYSSKAINGSHLLVLQDANTNCLKGTTAISWNQQGPAGATGPQGPAGPGGAAGPAGPAGPQGAKGDQGDPGAAGAPGTGATVGALASGDPNCATGGASVTDGNGNTAYACNGATGPAGPQGLQGQTGTTGPAGPQGPSGSSGVEIDAGQAVVSPNGSGGYDCGGFSVGSDAGTIQVNAYEIANDTECVISGFSSVPVLVSLNSTSSTGLPPGWFAGPEQPNGGDCTGSNGDCLIVGFPNSVLTHPFVYSWEAMQTAPPAAMSSAAAKRQQQAIRRMAALARPHHG